MTDERSEGTAGASQETPNNNTPALQVIAAFGGIRPMAKGLGIAVSTVQGWKERGAIPEARHEAILKAARKKNIDLDESALRASDPTPEGDAKETAGQQTTGGAEQNEDNVTKFVSDPGSSLGESDDDKQREKGESQADGVGDGDGDIAAAPASPVPADRHRGGRVSAFVLGAVVMAIGFGAAILTKGYWAPEVATGIGSQTVALEQEIDSLHKDLASLKSSLESQIKGATTGVPEALEKTVDSLKSEASTLAGRLKTLEASQGSGADSEELASLTQSSQSLTQKLQGIESSVAAIQTRLSDERSLAAGEMAQLLAFDRLKENVAAAEPYGAALDRLRGTLKDDAALTGLLSPLNASASSGVPSLTRLRVEFPAVARAVVVAGIDDGAENGVLAGIWSKLATVVTVRPKGPVDGDGPGAVVARSEVLLNDGDLAGAVKQLDGLTGAAAAAATTWRQEAEARLAADKALSAFGDKLIDTLATGG